MMLSPGQYAFLRSEVGYIRMAFQYNGELKCGIV
ncbi:Putative uncharacterized protein [Staphylococcus xylosus]|nr:Putative uncharacterized protein [Staphylococcus xylosus]